MSRLTGLGMPGGVRPITASSDIRPTIKDDFLTEILDAQDNQTEVRRIGQGDGEWGHYTHVSSLIDACARMHALAALDDRVITEKVTGGHRVMWQMGRYVEKHIRGQYLAATNKRLAFGRWKCLCERQEHVGMHPASLRCEACGTGLDHYHEYTLFDHENWIKGNPDLLLMFAGNWMMPVEVKSMNAKDFAALKAPKGDHVFQIGHYHRMAGLEGFKVLDKGIIIYCTKEFKFGSPYKEFHIDLTAPSVQNVLSGSIDIARQLRRTREDGVIPPRTLCSAHSETRAKNCPFVVSCFSRD
jgi:hypothetical protein